MAMMTVPLADKRHAAITQICLSTPDSLLADGRIIHFLSKLTTLSAGGCCAWELLFSSVATPQGTGLDARLITHTALPAAQRPMLADTALATRAKLLDALAQNDIAATAAPEDAPLPALRDRNCITLSKEIAAGLICAEAELPPGLLRQHLCTQPGNGFSLLLVPSAWENDELYQCSAGLSQAHQAMLAADPVFRFALTLWGPDAQANAAWLQGLTLNALQPVTPANPVSYPICLRKDPWRLLTLLPSTARLTLWELLTICGCPAEPGLMQQMCRTNWREDADQALSAAGLALLPMDTPLQENDLRYMGLEADSDLENALHMSPKLADMLRMSVFILRTLNVLKQPDGQSTFAAADPRLVERASLLLPSVGNIYEQFVRECCYKTMYCPYIPFATRLQPAPAVRVFLSIYDQGPGTKGYRRTDLPAGAPEPVQQGIIREQMIRDFEQYTTIDGQSMADTWWYALFNNMYSARRERNGLVHEQANLITARRFAEVFLLDHPDQPSLLKRLMMCSKIATFFPAS